MLLERDEPMDLLGALLDRARTGRGTSVFIGGEAGIGKTALVEAFVDALDRASTRPLWGACDALATPRPLGPLVDIAEQTGGKLRDALRAGCAPHELFQDFLSVARDDGRAVVAVVEDAHWADDATADFVKFVARRISRTPLLLLVTYREEEAPPSHPLMRAIAEVPPDHLRRVRLHGLSRESVAALARDRGRADKTDELHRITDGNPFLVTELLREGSDDLPPTLRDSLLARLQRLSPAARDWAELVAVMPDHAERTLLDRVFAADAQASLQECIDGHVLLWERLNLRYRHELARRVVEQSLSDTRRRLLNAQVLRLLEERAPSAAVLPQLVHHADAANDADAVMRHAPPAADEAARRGAHRQAAAFYRIALFHGASLPAGRRAALLDKLAWELMSSGSASEALAANERAGDAWRQAGDPLALGRNRRLRFQLYELSAVAPRGAETPAVNEAVKLLEPLGPSGELAMAYSEQAYGAGLREAHHESERLQALALAMAERVGDPSVLINVRLGGEKQRYLFFGAPDLDHQAQTLDMAKRHGNDALTAHCYYYLCLGRNGTCEHDGLAQLLREGLEFAESRDLDGYFALLQAVAARFALARGDWTEAGELAEKLLRQERVPGNAEYVARVAIAALACRRGTAGALDAVARVLVAWQTGVVARASHLSCLWLQSEALWLAGDRTAALEHARQARAVLRGIRDDARVLGIRSATQLQPWGAGAWLWRELPDQVPGEFDGVIGLQVDGRWREAAAFWAARHMPYEHALALVQGDDASAHREAFAILARLGASATIESCRRMLTERGVRFVPRGPRPSTTRSVFGLTQREMQVLALINDGLSNAAISRRLSRSTKTVEHHVAAILAKLGVTTRDEAARIARARGLFSVPIAGADPQYGQRPATK